MDSLRLSAGLITSLRSLDRFLIDVRATIEWWRRARCLEALMLDVVFLGLTLLFFAISIGYVAVCDRLMK
jgi:hypothetical protein